MNIKNAGSRGYNDVSFLGTCIISGLDKTEFLLTFKANKALVLRKDFVSYCFDYLSYKFGLVDANCDTILMWSVDEERFPTKTYNENLTKDFVTVSETLKCFSKNFRKSHAQKISY